MKVIQMMLNKTRIPMKQQNTSSQGKNKLGPKFDRK